MTTPQKTALASDALSNSGSDEVNYPHWQHNRVAMGSATFFHTVAFGLLMPFFPLILREFGAPDPLEVWVGYTLGAYFGLSFLLTPVWGAVADHYGRKLMVLRTSYGMAFIFALLPLMPNLAAFLALYLLLGTTNGFVPASNALVATNTPVRYMGRALSTVQTGTLIGASVGPALGAIVAGVLPEYKHLFWVATALICTGGTLALVLAREQHQRPQEPFRLHPLQDMAVVRKLPQARLLFFVYFVTTFTYLGSAAIVSVFTLQLLEGQGIVSGVLMERWLGGVSLAFAAASAMALPVWGRLLDRLGAGRTLVFTLLGAGLASVPMVFVQTPLQLVIVRFVLGLVAVGIGPAALTMIRILAPQGMESRVLAFGAAFGMLGIGGGPLIAGLIGPVLGLRAFFALNSVLLLGAFALWLRSYLSGLGHAPTSKTEHGSAGAVPEARP